MLVRVRPGAPKLTKLRDDSADLNRKLAISKRTAVQDALQKARDSGNTDEVNRREEELSLLTNYAMRPVWQKGEIPKVVLDAAYFTHEQFDDFVETLEKRGINHLLINSVPSEEVEVIVPFIKNYVLYLLET